MLRHASASWLIVVVLCGFFTTVLSAPAIAQNGKAPAADAEKADKGGEDPDGKPSADVEKKLDTTTVGIGGGVLAVLTILFGLTSIWVKKDSLRYGVGSKKWTRIVVVPYALGAIALAVSVGLNWTEYAFLASGGLWGAFW